jgi:hypothetical protein
MQVSQLTNFHSGSSPLSLHIYIHVLIKHIRRAEIECALYICIEPRLSRAPVPIVCKWENEKCWWILIAVVLHRGANEMQLSVRLFIRSGWIINPHSGFPAFGMRRQCGDDQDSHLWEKLHSGRAKDALLAKGSHFLRKQTRLLSRISCLEKLL